jgi:hypothetical protein
VGTDCNMQVGTCLSLKVVSLYSTLHTRYANTKQSNKLEDDSNSQKKQIKLSFYWILH